MNTLAGCISSNAIRDQPFVFDILFKIIFGNIHASLSYFFFLGFVEVTTFTFLNKMLFFFFFPTLLTFVFAV